VSLTILRSVEETSNVIQGSYCVTSKERAYAAAHCNCGNIAYGAVYLRDDPALLECPHCGTGIHCRLDGLVLPPEDYKVTRDMAADLEQQMNRQHSGGSVDPR